MDSHYCAVFFQYLLDYAVMFKESAFFLCWMTNTVLSGTPVAAAERGKQVLVSTSQSFQVCDHGSASYNCAFKS